MKTYMNFAGFTVCLALLLLLTFGILQWLHIPAGSFLDWVIAGACFWWLLLIVTVPWNIHFEAKEVLAEAAESKQKGVVRQGSVGSVGRVGRRPKVGGIIVGCILIGKCLDAVLTFWS